MPNIRVLVADDHPIVRQGIRKLLETSGEITVVGEAKTGREALQMIKSLQPDVVVLDMEMPDLSGVDVVKKVAESKLKARILESALTMTPVSSRNCWALALPDIYSKMKRQIR